VRCAPYFRIAFCRCWLLQVAMNQVRRTVNRLHVCVCVCVCVCVVGWCRWWTGPWQHCSVTCGDQGTRKRTVLCVRQLGADQQIALEDWQCEDLDRPPALSACQLHEPCPPQQGRWRTGPWSDVSVVTDISLSLTSVRYHFM